MNLSRIIVSGNADDGVVVASSGNHITLNDVRYVAKSLMVLGVRQYRVWVQESSWQEMISADGQVFLYDKYEAFEGDVLLRLIDADPALVRRCRMPD